MSIWMMGKKSNQRQTKKNNMLAKKKKKPSLISLNGILLYLYFETEIKMLSSTSVSAKRLHKIWGQKADSLQLPNWTEVVAECQPDLNGTEGFSPAFHPFVFSKVNLPSFVIPSLGCSWENKRYS